MWISLGVTGILLSLVIRSYFIQNGSEIADIHSLYEMGEITLKGGNPYILLNYNTYPPLSLYLQAATIQLSQFFNIPFYILIKLWPNLADLLTGLIIFYFLIKKGAALRSAVCWSLIFLLNPISIIISSAHGQIDSIPTLLVITSILILQFKSSKSYIFAAALLLGLAISIKPNPLILVPIFLMYLYKRINILEKAVFSLLTFAPIFFLLLPFLANSPQYILEKMFSYSGSNDFGLSAFLKLIHFYQNATYNLPYIDELLRNSKIIFLILLACFAVIFRNSKNIIKLVLTVYLLFLTVYFGISAQYLSWILAFAVLEKDKMIIPYSFFGLIALLGFYLYFNPTILLVQFAGIQPYYFQFMLIYALGNLLFWLTTFFWLIKILIKDRIGYKH